MNRNWLNFGILTFVLALLVPVARADARIGIVSVQDVLDTIDEGKAAKAQMEKELLAKKQDLEKKQKEYKAMEDSLEKQRLVLSASALSDKQKEMETKKNDLQKAYLNSQTEMQKLEAKLMADILKKIRAVITKIGQEGGYDVVVEKNEGGVFYSKDTLDLTKRVIEEYNKAYKR
jgi:outer membrane protein